MKGQRADPSTWSSDEGVCGSSVGIDLANARLDMHVCPTGEAWTVPSVESDIQALVAELQSHAPSLLVLEATGGYELAVVGALAAAGFPRRGGRTLGRCATSRKARGASRRRTASARRYSPALPSNSARRRGRSSMPRASN